MTAASAASHSPRSAPAAEKVVHAALRGDPGLTSWPPTRPNRPLPGPGAGVTGGLWWSCFCSGLPQLLQAPSSKSCVISPCPHGLERIPGRLRREL
jgi:hypothetical protein